MDDLIAFLRARLDHLELAGRTMTAQLDREWTLADVDAKRRMLKAWPDTFGNWTAEQADAAKSTKEQMLKLLALPYAGHTDYREEWRP